MAQIPNGAADKLPMAGQHWGGRERKRSRWENALIGIFSTIVAAGFNGSLLLAAASLLRAENCTVTRVSDGDTMRATCGAITRTIRLSSVDAPELRQPYGPEAKQATTDRVT